MNQFEFSKKTWYIYSNHRNEKFNCSDLNDVLFDAINAEMKNLGIVLGSPFTGQCIYSDKVRNTLQIMEDNFKKSYPRIQRLKTFFCDFENGDDFYLVSADAPAINHHLAMAKLAALKRGDDIAKVHNEVLATWGRLSTRYRHISFGYGGIKEIIGEVDRTKRQCRFCGKKSTDGVHFRHIAHAISESLGNTLLICNEECDECNNRLAKVENNLVVMLDFRRVLAGVKSKTTKHSPAIEGKNFAIRANDNDEPIVYIKKEELPKGVDGDTPFYFRFHHNKAVTHQGLYKALVKMVIDLLPASELSHFKNTVKWINGSLTDSNSPSYYSSYNVPFTFQPTIDIFLRRDEGAYCTVLLHCFDVLYLYVVPFVDVDRGHFKKDDQLIEHWKKVMSLLRMRWIRDDSKDSHLSYPWVDCKVDPNNPYFQIRPAADNAFRKYENIDKKERTEHVFPEFLSDGIVVKHVNLDNYAVEYIGTLTDNELIDVSLNVEYLNCIVKPENNELVLTIKLIVSDSANEMSYFKCAFNVIFGFAEFNKYLSFDDHSFSIDYHLRDYLLENFFEEGEKILRPYRIGSSFESCDVRKLFEYERIRFKLCYLLPIGDGKYYPVDDSEIHSMG